MNNTFDDFVNDCGNNACNENCDKCPIEEMLDEYLNSVDEYLDIYAVNYGQHDMSDELPF